MMKEESPSARLGRIMRDLRIRFSLRILSRVFFPNRKASTQAQDMACERMVASAAPCTPMSKANIKMGSRMMFATAPIKTESIPVFANPCAVINAFMPRVS